MLIRLFYLFYDERLTPYDRSSYSYVCETRALFSVCAHSVDRSASLRHPLFPRDRHWASLYRYGRGVVNSPTTSRSKWVRFSYSQFELSLTVIISPKEPPYPQSFTHFNSPLRRFVCKTINMWIKPTNNCLDLIQSVMITVITASLFCV